MVVPLTSTLNAARNDTGRTAFCGPYVVSAIAGYRVSKVEEQIYRFRGEDAGAARKIIEGTTEDDVSAALAAFGYQMLRIQSYGDVEKKLRPSVWQWLQKPRPRAFAYYLLGIDTRREGHWIVIHGTKLSDTYTEGKWTEVAYGPHKGCKIWAVYEVRRSLADCNAL